MNQLIQLLTTQLGEKGANKKRNLTVLALLWIAWTLHGVDRRVAAVEAKLGIVTQAVTTNAVHSPLTASAR